MLVPLDFKFILKVLYNSYKNLLNTDLSLSLKSGVWDFSSGATTSGGAGTELVTDGGIGSFLI